MGDEATANGGWGGRGAFRWGWGGGARGLARRGLQSAALKPGGAQKRGGSHGAGRESASHRTGRSGRRQGLTLGGGARARALTPGARARALSVQTISGCGHSDLISAAALGLVEGGIGAAQQCVQRVVRATVSDSNGHRYSDGFILAVDLPQSSLRHRRADLLGHGDSAFYGRVRQQHRELIPAQSAGNVRTLDAIFQNMRYSANTWSPA